MSAELSSRDMLIANWYFNDALGYKGQTPTPEAASVYMKALIDIVSADGVLAKEELKWILGFAATIGMSQDMLDELQTYEPGKCEEVQYIFQDLDLISTSISRLSFIYNGFRAASADGELHPKELKAICKLGKKLGLTAEEIEQCRLLTEEEENLRRKRAKILFPEGFDNFLKHFTEQYL